MEFRKATKGCEILLPSGSYDPKNLRKFVKDGKFILYAIYDANYEFPDRFKSDTPLDHCISNKALILGWYTSLVTAKRLTTFWNNRLKDVIILALEYYVVSNYSDLTVEIREKNPSI